MSCAEFWQHVCERESQWWARHAEVAERLTRRGLQPSACRFAGEIMFLFLQLKPCVVLSHLDGEAADAFVAEVLHDASAPGGALLPAHEFRVFRIPAHVRTEVYAFGGEVAIVDVRADRVGCGSDDDGALTAQLLALEQCLPDGADAHVYASEAFWARAFDYPISLDDMVPSPPVDAAAGVDEDENADAGDALIEIGYVDAASGALLTFYGAAQRSALMQRALAHYQRYRARAESACGVRLTMDIRPIDEDDDDDEGEGDDVDDFEGGADDC